MQKLFVEFTHIINGNEYVFKAYPNAPLADAKEALFQVMKDLAQIEEQSKAQKEQMQKEQEQKDPEKVVEISKEA